MTFALAWTLITLAAALALFVSDRVRLDVVAMGVVVSLVVGGVLEVDEALAGFGDPLVLMIAGLFIVGDGLARTGLTGRAGAFLARVGHGSEPTLIAASVLTSALLSAFMSSTGAVALLIPVLLGVARETGIAPGRLLLPLSFGALLGGMLTLVGTPPNLVVSAALQEAGYEPFAFFDFTPPGLLMTAAGVLFLATIGRRILPSRAAAAPTSEEEIARLSLDRLEVDYELGESSRAWLVPAGCPAGGRPLRELGLRERYGVVVVAVVDAQGRALDEGTPGPDTRLAPGSIAVLQGTPPAIEAAAAAMGLEPAPPSVAAHTVTGGNARVAEVILTPRSQLLAQTLAEARFRERFGLQVVGIRRLGEALEPPYGSIRLRFGDSLLVRGSPERLDAVRARHRQFVLVGEGAVETSQAHRRRAIWALLAVALMVVLLTAGIVPAVTAVLLAAGVMVLARCTELPGAYRAVSWESLILIAGMLPMATALRKTGAIDEVVEALVGTIGPWGPAWTLAVLFLVTSGLSLLMSNTATCVLLAPVALGTAREMGVDPHAMLMGVALAASTAFSTPMASPTNTLVLAPGGYRFGDFLRAGIPLQAIVFALTMLVVPLLFPF